MQNSIAIASPRPHNSVWGIDVFLLFQKPPFHVNVLDHFKMADILGNTVYPDLTPAGVLGWLTGQKHVPLNGEKLDITVNFDHDCLTRNESHNICFPIVGVCGRVVTLPVAHMKKSDEFKHVFILAFCNGQSFANV